MYGIISFHSFVRNMGCEIDKAIGDPLYLLDFLDARRDFLCVHIRYFSGYQYLTCLQDTIQSSYFAMSSLSSSVAAHTTVTSASGPPAWFHGSRGENVSSLLGAWHRGKRSVREFVDQSGEKISSPGGIAEGAQVPALRTSLALTPSTGQGPQKRAKPQMATNPKSPKSPIVPIGASHPRDPAGVPGLVGGEMDCHPQGELRGPQMPIPGKGTVTSVENRAVIEQSTGVIERTNAAPSSAADWGTMASPMGPIVVDSDTPPSLRELPEPQVRKNLFAAGPISPIVDQLDAENRRVGPSTPDPYDRLGPAREAVVLIQQALSGSRQNPTIVDSSPAPMSGSRRFPSLVEESPALEAPHAPPSGSRLNPMLILESPTQIEEDECDQWFPPALEQGSDNEDEEIGVLERRARHHSPISVASSPAVPMSGTRDRPMLVEESPEPHYIVVEDSPAPQCIVVEESPAPMSGVKDRPVFVEESPPTSPVPMSGTNDRPSLVDESPAVPMVGNLCWGGENPLEGGSATLPINLVSPPTTASRMEEPQSRAIPNWGGAPEATTGAKHVFAPVSRDLPPTVVHQSPQCIVVEESPPPPPQPNPVDPVSPPPSPQRVAYIEHVEGIPYLIRPSQGGSSGGGHSSSGGAPAPVTARPARPQRSTGGSSGLSVAGGAAGGGGDGSLPPRWGGGPSTHHHGGPPRARGAADLKHTCDCPRCVVHFETCIQALTAQVRDLQAQSQELQRSHRELSQAVAAVTGISQSYRDRMSQILSTLAKQEEVVRGYQRESKGVAAGVADHLKMSNSNTAKCFRALETLAARCDALTSRLDEWDRWYATPTEPPVRVPPPPSTAPPVPEPTTAPTAPMGAPSGSSGGGCPIPFSGHPSHDCIYHPHACVDSGWPRGEEERHTHTPTTRSQQLLRGGEPRINKKKPRSPNGGRRQGVNNPPWSLRLLTPVRRGRSTPSPKTFSLPPGDLLSRRRTLRTRARFLP